MLRSFEEPNSSLSSHRSTREAFRYFAMLFVVAGKCRDHFRCRKVRPEEVVHGLPDSANCIPECGFEIFACRVCVTRVASKNLPACLYVLLGLGEDIWLATEKYSLQGKFAARPSTIPSIMNPLSSTVNVRPGLSRCLNDKSP
jgi:hypothetical protein